MDIQFYKNFITIVESGSLTAAAKLLHVAQPALSNQLKTLETEYNAQLLVRGSRRVSLTDAGKILYNKAKSLQELENAARREIAEFSSGISGTLRLALTLSSALSLSREFFAQFHRKYPGVKYLFYECDSRKTLELLQSGVCELGIVRGPLHLPTSVESIYEREDPLYAVFRKDCNWLQGLTELKVDDFKDVPICVSDRFKLIFTKACEVAGFEPDIICENIHLISSLSWAKAGLGVSIIPLSIYEANADGELMGLEIQSDMLASTRCFLMKRDCSAVSRIFCEEYMAHIGVEIK